MAFLANLGARRKTPATVATGPSPIMCPKKFPGGCVSVPICPDRTRDPKHPAPPRIAGTALPFNATRSGPAHETAIGMDGSSRLTCIQLSYRGSHMLAKNVGTTDRYIRIGLGALLLLAFIINPSGSYSWLYIVGAVVALATGLLNFCGLYRVFGISTCQLNNK